MAAELRGGESLSPLAGAVPKLPKGSEELAGPERRGCGQSVVSVGRGPMGALKQG